MTVHRSPIRLPAQVALLEQAVRYTVDSLSLVTFDVLEVSTPCRDWNMSELLSHLGDSLAALHEAALLGRITLLPDAIPNSFELKSAAFDPVAALEDQAGRLIDAWTRLPGSTPVSMGPYALTVDAVAGAGAVEVAIHGWDVASACGTSRPIPDELAPGLLACSSLWVSPTDRPARFAPPRPVPAGACTHDRLLAFLGRDPGG